MIATSICATLPYSSENFPGPGRISCGTGVGRTTRQDVLDACRRVRIPEDAIKPGRSPVLAIKGSETLYVTKVCCDPYVSVTKARMVAADCDVPVNF